MTPGAAWASHFRGANLTWEKSGANAATFHLTAAFRRDGFPGTASDGFAAVGDVIEEDIGATNFNFGDGANTSTLHFRVSAVNPADNFLIGEALDPGNDGPLVHQYAGAGPFSAGFSSCCTIGNQNNNANGDYNNATVVNFALSDHSPLSSLTPIVDVRGSGIQHFAVPASDRAGLALTWRLGTVDEGCASACSDVNPAGLTINSSTGVVSWDTTGKAQGLYQAVIVVESHVANAVVANTQVNFLIRVSSISNPPFWVTPPTPADGAAFSVCPGAAVSFDLRATENRTGAVIHIDNLGLPTGATFTSTDGKPANATFSWTPLRTQTGNHFVTFTAQDERSPPGSAPPRTFSIVVGGSGCAANQHPVWTTAPVNGTVITTLVGKPLSLSLRAKDLDLGDVVHISGTNLPAGSVMSSTDGNPASATFSWTPGVAGTFTISFDATDGISNAQTRTIQVIVGKRDTQLIADAVVALQFTPQKVYVTPHAYLSVTDPTAPLAGKTIVFKAGSTTLCSSVTDATGMAQCTGVVNDVNAILALGYTASFAGDAGYKPSSGNGAVVRVGGTVP